MRIQVCFVMSAALLAGGVVFAAEDVNVPVRPIGVNGQEAWNGRATSFLYAPTFGFKAIAGAAKYRFSVNGKTFEAATPTAALSPVWGEIPVGWVTVEARGVAADGRDLGVAGTRRFWKKAAYRPGAYPPAARPYGKAAELALLNVLNSKSIAILEKTGDIDRAYPHNCYPAKMLAQVVTGMLELAKMRPDLKARAVGVAEKAADWMIAHTIAAPSPLAGFPLTYDHHPEAAKVEPTACARISKERAGISMNIYPGYMGRAYVALYEADGKAKYLAAAEAIAARYLAMQGEDGTWPLNQRIADGTAIGANRVMPIQCVIPLFEALARVTGKTAYREGADRAFAFIERGPLRTWNWEGQFEDTPQAPKYQNLTKHDACSTAIYLLSRFPGDRGRLAQARELLRFSEDQFVFWEKPYTPADEPKEFVEWNRPWAGKWECPGVTEQYSCYRPIDASASKLIQTYLALYRAERNPLDLAKAKTLGDQATRMQRADGFIPTFWSDHPHVVHDNWVNCMLYTAETLAELAEVAPPVGLGVCAHLTRGEFANRNRAFRLMRDAGIDGVCVDFDWRWYQKAKDAPIDWKRCDAVVDDAAKFGITVLPILFNPPDWARPVQKHVPEWRSFVRETARHFKGRIPVYEIWNEENHPGFWPNPDAGSYVQVLRAAYEEIKAVDPAARVAFGGTAGCDLGYIDRAYKAGAKSCCDIMNVHPYCWPNSPKDGTSGVLDQLKRLMTAHGDGAKPIWITEMGWPTHKSNIPTPGVLTAGLRLARPDQKAWRVGCVGVSDDLEVLESSVSGIRALLGKESTVAAYTPAGLNEALAKNELDVVVYPFDESYPLETSDAVIGFVRNGGVLVDFGGCPMYYARKDGAHVEKAADGTLNRDRMHAALRLAVTGPRAENGLKYNQRFYATKVGEAAGLKYDPEGVRCFRFFLDTKLQPGDEMIPLLTAKGANGKDGVGACVVRFGSDFKGALVLTGSADGRCGSSEAAQARNCLDMIEISRQAGIERLFFYEFLAPEKDPYYSEDHFGIVHRDFSPKPAYESLRDHHIMNTGRSLVAPSGDATALVQGAIDRAFLAGGGMVRLGKGRWNVKALRLRSRVTLHLESGAEIVGSRNIDDYFVLDDDKVEPVPQGWITHEAWDLEQSCSKDNFTRRPASRWNNGLIRLLGATDAAIIGESGSVIDGMNPYDPLGEESYRGPHGISAINCTNLTLKGYTIRNTGNWAHRIADTVNLTVDGVTCLAGHDGVHVNGCDGVRIENCTVKTGDDCIAGFDNADVVVRNCYLNTACSGFRFAGTGVLIEKCELRGPAEYGFRGSLSRADKEAGAPSGKALRTNMLSFFTYYADGTHPVRQNAGGIVIRDCVSHGTDRYLHYNYGNEKWQRGKPVADITFERVRATGLKLPICAWGDQTVPVRLRFKDCELGYDQPVRSLLVGSFIGGIEIDGLDVRGVDGPLVRLWNADAVRPEIRAQRMKGVTDDMVPESGPWKVSGI